MNDDQIIQLYFDRSEQAIKETDTKYGGYCYSIAYNILTNPEDAEESVSGTESAEEAAIRKEILASLNRFLGTLKETERSVFLCRYWYLDSTEEIAEKSGFTVSKVKSMLFRIRKRLYAQLTEEGLV